MKKTRKSFFEKLTGSIRMNENHFNDYDESIDETEESTELEKDEDMEPVEGQLAVDMYQTASSVVIKAFTAGVRQSDLTINLTRETVELKGERYDRSHVHDEDYSNRELYWGPFSRKIILPCEVDIDQADALADNGLLVITLPKLDKNRSSSLRVRANS